MNNTFYESPNDYRSYLAHHGVLGMKWGIRHDPIRKGRKRKFPRLFQTRKQVMKQREEEARYIMSLSPKLRYMYDMEKQGYEVDDDPIGFEDATVYSSKVTDRDGQNKLKFENWSLIFPDSNFITIRKYSRGDRQSSSKDASMLQSTLMNNYDSISKKAISNVVNSIDDINRFRDPENRYSKSDVRNLLSEHGVSISSVIPDKRQPSGMIPIEVHLESGELYGYHSIDIEGGINPETGKIELSKRYSING